MSDISLLPGLFTAFHLQRLAWYGSSDMLRAALPVITSKKALPRDASTADLLEAAFAILRREYPVEYVYKACLLKKTIFGRHSPRTTALYMELPVAGARADMLLVNGDATVLEVKTRFDDPSRLRTQLEQYYRCFTRVTVMAEEGHAAAYLDALPDHVGVSALTPRFSVSVWRPAAPHSAGLDHRSLFGILRQGEYYRIANDLDFDLSLVDPADRYQVFLECFSTLPIAEAHARVVSALYSRQPTEVLAALCRRLPESLHAAVFSYRLRRRDWDDLIRVLLEHPNLE